MSLGLKGRGTLHLITGLLAIMGAGALSGCAEAGPENADTRAVGQELNWLTTRMWDTKNINVCWNDSGLATEKAWVMDVVKGQRSWEQAGNVNFVGWGQCSSGETGIRITNADGAQTAWLGQSGNVVEMTLDFDISDNNYSICVEPSPDLNREDCIKAVALHEFGHALSIAHEHKRVDKPSWCTSTAGTAGDVLYGAFDLQSIMGYCTDPDDLSGLDRRGVARMYGERDGDTPNLGDFNGDGKDDILCHDSVDGRKWIDLASGSGEFNGTNWSTSANWCGHDTGKLYKGDFNGDGLTDLLCHDVANGYKWVDLADSSGQFGGTDWSRNAQWCYHNTAQLLVGDFNGDGKDDIMCHDTASGYKWIDLAYGSGEFNGTNWERDANWCNHDAGRLLVGDFDGDGRDDIMCHDVDDGRKWIDYASSSGQFGGTNWNTTSNWCGHDGAQLIVGDFNADGKDDLLCHDTTNGYKWVDLANSSGQFGGTDWSRDAQWCGHSEGRLSVGDVDGDGKDDILCHDVKSGYKWVDLAYSSGQFNGTNWERDANWCNHDAAILR